MFHTIDACIAGRDFESGATPQALDRLTDAALGKAVAHEGRPLAPLAGHITTTNPQWMRGTGLQVTPIDEHAPPPAHAAPIAADYHPPAVSLMQAGDGTAQRVHVRGDGPPKGDGTGGGAV